MRRIWKVLICIFILMLLITSCDPSVEVPVKEETPSPTPENEPTQQTLTPTPVTNQVFNEVANGRIPLIFSHGGAPCDIDAAVYFDKHPQVDLIGMVLSRGEIRQQNALDDWPVFILDVLDSPRTRFGLGSNKFMDANPHDFPSSWRDGGDVFWNIPLPPPSTDFDVYEGYQLIIDLVNGSQDKVTIIAMASMIDVALALQNDPGIINNISHVVIMGGAFNVPGNLNDAPGHNDNIYAEWNMWIDSAAAKYIFDSGVPVSLVPLDAIQYLVNHWDIDKIQAINDHDVAFIQRIWQDQMSWGSEFLIWDTITAVAVTNPEHFHWVVDGVDVITAPGIYQGHTIPLNNSAHNIRYATGADYSEIMDQLFETYSGDQNFTQTMPHAPIIELEGIWEGDTSTFHIIFDLGPACRPGMICGTFEIPNFNLSGDIAFVDINGSTFEFKAINLSTGTHSAATYEYLQLLSDGTLRYHTESKDSSNEAILYKN